MAMPLTIDVILRVKDQIKEGAEEASKALEKIEKSSKKAKKGLDAVEKSSGQTRRTLKELGQEKVILLMEAEDRLKPALEQAGAKELTRKALAGDDRQPNAAVGAMQSSDIFGAVPIDWDQWIAGSFSEWWSSKGSQFFTEIAVKMGEVIGNGLNRGMMELNPNLEEGDSQTPFTSVLVTAAAEIKALEGVINLVKSVHDAYTFLETIGNFLYSQMPAAAAVGMPSGAGMVTGTGAVAGTAALSGASIAVMAAVAGGILAAMGLGAAYQDLKKANRASTTWDKDRYTRQGLTKGGLVGTGAAIGAAIGTSIFPGPLTVIGALIGAGVGGLTALVGGDSISELFKTERERSHEALIQIGEDLELALADYNETISRTSFAKGLIGEYKDLLDYMNSPEFDETKAEEVQNRMKEIMETLQTMFPDLITGYETVNGLGKKHVEILEKEIEKIDEQAERNMRQGVIDFKEKLPQSSEDYGEIETSLAEKQAEWDKSSPFRNELIDLYEEYRAASVGVSADKRAEFETDYANKANELAKEHGVEEKFEYGYDMVTELEILRKRTNQLNEDINDLTAQKADLDDKMQAYYDSSVQLIWKDTGISQEQLLEAKTNLESLHNAVTELIQNDSVSEETKAMIEEILPGFSQIDGAAEQMEFLQQGIKNMTESIQPALDQIEALNNSLDHLPEYKKITFSLNYKLPALPKTIDYFFGPAKTHEKNAAGGLINSARLSWVGEDGPEAIIPLSGKYRKRGLELYEQAGRFLGIGKYEKGRIPGPEQTAATSATEPVAAMTAGPAVSAVSLQVSASPQIQVQVSQGSSREDIMQILRSGLAGMTDQLLNVLTDKVLLVTENMPGGGG